jgi:hypothetical protein
MTIFVRRNGELVNKETGEPMVFDPFFAFPTPRIARFECYPSPIDGKTISSWRQRDRDMAACDAVDPRDIPKAAFERREAMVARMNTQEEIRANAGSERDTDTFEWRDPD